MVSVGSDAVGEGVRERERKNAHLPTVVMTRLETCLNAPAIRQCVTRQQTKVQKKGIEKKRFIHDRRLVEKGHFITLCSKYSKKRG